MTIVQSNSDEPVPLSRDDISRLADRLSSDLDQLRSECELREKFISTLTHDLRNPLGAIKLAAQLLLRNPIQAEAQRKISRIISNVNRADKMIQDLLDFSRIRAGQRLPMQITKLNLSKIVSDVFEDLSLFQPNRFLLNSDPEVDGFWCEDGLRRVVENLVFNAVKYGDGGRPVTVTLKRFFDRVQILVHNEGKEIPLPERTMLFDPFRRSPAADSSSQKGWGLGLALVRGVAQAHGGSVWLESSASLGTTFFVELPLDCRPLIH